MHIKLDARIKAVLQSLTQDKFAFTVTMKDVVWDVYYYQMGDETGTIALTIPNDEEMVVVGLFTQTRVTAEKCLEFFATRTPE